MDSKVAARKQGPRKTAERNLTRELSTLLAKTLLPSLEERAKEDSVAGALTAQYHDEHKANRTAEKRDEWVERTLEQVGVAWILSCVFIRTLEDRGYLTHLRLAGEGAADSEHLFFDLFPSLTQRDYLLAVFRELSHVPGGEEVLGPKHNPAWRLAPSTEALRELLTFLREVDAEGRLQWTFAGEDTRFLGDLYQDISEAVRERYALLQTPNFVEEFILDLTLEPAIAEYGLEEVRLLDPTCGSGHFLLGAFKRLFEGRQRKAPGKPVKEHALAALGQVYGVDVNPYAAAIARFRLVLAYLRAAEIDKLRNAPRLPSNVVVADSLAFFAKDQNLHFAGTVEDAGVWGGECFRLEDPQEATRVFSRKYHAVVGNPPYITCKDSKLRELYRNAYKSAAGKYALSAPFTERFFQLAVDDGFVGMINANSFMKREFGTALVEKVLPTVELTQVIDTAGAYIPGHGTPTVLLFGRNRAPITDKVSAVLGKRGEPETPKNPEKGLVWSSIRDHFREVGFDNEFISTADVPRETLSKHPWSLGGGGAAELKELLEQTSEKRLRDIATDIGFDAIMGEDELFIGSPDWLNRLHVPPAHSRTLVEGEAIRDWSLSTTLAALFPYSDKLEPALPSNPGVSRHLWRYRQSLIERRQFGKTTLEAGLKWFEYRSFYKSKRRTPLSIAFAFVATHNHFVLERGGKVFKQSAPIIKLAVYATEDDHLALLAYLNSSTAAFFFRQAGHNKGAQGVNEGFKSETWEQFLEHSSALVGSLPLPSGWHSLAALGRRADTLARERSKLHPHALGLTQLGSQRALTDCQAQEGALLRELVTLQEEIDFAVYRLWDLTASAGSENGQNFEPGRRPFERELIASFPTTRWFRSNDYEEPIVASGDERVLEREISLVEQPEFKRRWTLFDWKHGPSEALSSHALDAVEAMLRTRTAPLQFSDLVSGVDTNEVLTNAFRTVYGEDVDIAAKMSNLLLGACAPWLGCQRFSDSGIAKRIQWEGVWALQRREDAGEKVDIPVPPKYDSKDFRDPIYWRLRGKLDVPKERFISYPGAEKDDDKSPLYGWAGWDHLQQATALAGLYHERKTENGWPADRLVPLLAGLLELLPWLKQWHNEPTDELGGEGAGDWYERYIEAEARSLGKSLDDLRDWRPPKGGRGRKK